MGTSPQDDKTVGFEETIKPMFRAHDRDSMRRAFDLWDYSDVSAHASAILDRLRDGSMPCDGAWAAQKVDVFQTWVKAGKPR